MKINKRNLDKNAIQTIFCLAFVLTTFILVAYRITLHADPYDEIINLSVAHRISLGQLPFYKCWEAYQSGDVLMAPFLFLYEKIFRTTSGIVLYSRILYLITITIISFIVYKFTNHFLEKRKSIFIGCVCLSYQIYGLYYLWYDVVATFLLMIGCILIISSFISPQKGTLKLILAGISHAFMGFSYPSFVLLALVIAIVLLIYSIKEMGFKAAIKKVIWYYIGAIFVVLCFAAYIVFIVGFTNFTTWINIVLNYAATGPKIEKHIVYDICNSFIKVNKFLIIPTFILIFIYFKSFRKRSLIKWLIYGIIAFSFINQIFFVIPEFKGYLNPLAYIALWGPFLYYLLEKKHLYSRILLLFLWMPSILSSISITLTTAYGTYGPLKSWQSFLPGGIVSIIFMVMLLKETVNSGISKKYIALLIPLIVIFMLLNSYNYFYLNPKESFKDSKRISTGIYKGIKTSDPMMLEGYPELQSILEPYFSKYDSILASGIFRPVYLMSTLKPVTSSVAVPCETVDGKTNWNYTFKYFQFFDEYPDIMVLEKNDLHSPQIKKLLKDNYERVYDGKIVNLDLSIYIIKKK